MPILVVKTFVMEREDTHQATIVDEQIQLIEGMIDLRPVLNRHSPSGKCQATIYDPSTCSFVKLAKVQSSTGLIPQHFLEPSIVMMRFANANHFTVDLEYSKNNSSEELKETRSRPRFIGEVIEIVKKWRDLHIHGHRPWKKRLNLQEAAKVIGIPKKSLDDYYCQLRLGELYQFDFNRNLNKKMRVLRDFVSNYKPEKKQAKPKKHNQKHPKHLKIINFYDLETHNLQDIVETSRNKHEVIALTLPVPLIPQVASLQRHHLEEELKDQLIVHVEVPKKNPSVLAVEETVMTNELLGLEKTLQEHIEHSSESQGQQQLKDIEKKETVVEEMNAMSLGQ